MKTWIDSQPLSEPSHCGDFVDFRQLGPRRHALVVGDVAGRGPAVALAAGRLRAHVRGIVERHAQPQAAMQSTCEFFTRELVADETPFASLFIAVADLTERWLAYASAGHEPGLLFDDDGGHEHLHPTGPVLGLGIPFRYAGGTASLRRHAVLVVVTDGITEARPRRDGEHRFFGSAGVVRALREALRHRHDPARAIASAAKEHAQGRLTDDATVAVSSFSAAALPGAVAACGG